MVRELPSKSGRASPAIEQGPGFGGVDEQNSLKLTQQKVVLGRRQ